jgi:hypothetical protein
VAVVFSAAALRWPSARRAFASAAISAAAFSVFARASAAALFRALSVIAEASFRAAATV